MIPAQLLEEIWDGRRSPQVMQDVDQILLEVFTTALALFQPKPDQVRDGFFRIVDDGVQEAMVDSDKPLFGGEEQFVCGNLRVLLRVENQTSSFHGARYS